MDLAAWIVVILTIAASFLATGWQMLRRKNRLQTRI